MKQFINGTPEAFDQLETRARRSCVRFRNQELPDACRPDRADVGFEFDAGVGTARLCVQRDIQYSGTNPEIGEWFRSGVREFPDFNALTKWIQGPLREAFGESMKTNLSATAPDTSPKDAASLTDMPTVLRGVRDIHRPLYLDEDAIFDNVSRGVRGQDHAIRSLASVMVRHCAREHPKRPAVLFAVGPSGVGKTRTAETLADTLRELDTETGGYHFLRLDMSEYQEAHRVSQLIGSPQGYVGHGEGSQLLDTLRSNPRTIVLFDEIEKSHPAILRVLMNAMDAGRLSSASRSSSGHEIDCRQAVFLFTSNLDAKSILNELEAGGNFGNRTVEDEVCRKKLQAAGIAPEIVGRIGRFLVFRPLNPETRAEIMTAAIVEVAAEYGLQVDYVEPQVIVELMKKSRSDGFGMRPGQYMIDDALGGIFAAAAKDRLTGPFRISGPPFECISQPSSKEPMVP